MTSLVRSRGEMDETDGIVHVGLIGYGMAGKVFHAPVIQAVPQLKLTKVVERNKAESKQRYPWVDVVRHHDAILSDEQIELVVIATPNSSHFSLAREALRAGKHVVVDKPFTLTSAEAQELIDLSRERNRIITVFHNRRWDSDFRTVLRLVHGKLLGRLVDYEAHFDRFRSFERPNAWREAGDEPGSGILYDLGSHLIDQAQVLFGLPDMVTAHIRRQRDSARTDDNFDILLDYTTDASLKVTLKASMLARLPGPRFALHGTKGSFIKSGMDPQEEALKLGNALQGNDWGVEPRSQYGTIVSNVEGLEVEGLVTSLPGCYQAFYQNVAHAIRGRAELAVTPEQAKNTIRIIELALESSAQKRTLPFSL